MINLTNKEPKCIGCLYNTTKTKGGYGKECNGYTMTKYNRCPRWKEKSNERSMANDPQ